MIIRLYCESDFEQINYLIKYVLSIEILGYNQVQKVNDKNDLKEYYGFGQLTDEPVKANSPDPFLRSMSFWYLKDYKKALLTLYDIDINQIDELSSSTGLSHYSNLGNSKDSMISHVFNFYIFLKSHTFVVRQHQQDRVETGVFKINKSSLTNKNKNELDISPVERRLHFIAAYYHLVNGCPLLTLDVLSRLPKYIYLSNEKKN